MGIPIAHRRPHVTGQRPAHAPAGAETGGTATDPIPRPAPPVCQAHDKKIFCISRNTKLPTDLMAWDFRTFIISIGFLKIN